MITIWIRYFYVKDFHYNLDLSTKLWDFVQNNIPSQHKALLKLSGSSYNQHWDYISAGNLKPPSTPFAINILEEDPRDIAEQITIIEWENFKLFDIFDSFCAEK